MAIALEISQISKSFDKKLVLDDISFKVQSNQIFGFVGLNGVGKTTLIKIILDLLDQDTGDVEMFGVNKILPKSRQKICYLPEKFQPSNNLTGREFIKFTLSFYKQKINEKQLQELCVNLDLDYKILGKKITQYSKGMTQKIGLIAVLMSKAELIILDEPMSGLDPKARIKLKKELINYKNKGNAVFFSSHILADMDEICDEISVLNNSRIVFQGTPDAFKIKHKQENLDKAFLKEIDQDLN